MHIRLILPLCATLIAGCATTVASQAELFATTQDRKECYSYDTQTQSIGRNMPRSIALGVVGGLFPPLMIITALSNAASSIADQASLPSKCGITFDQATKEAWTASFYANTTSIWNQKTNKGGITVVQLTELENGCSNHEISIWRIDGDIRKTFKQTVRICRAEDGEPAIKTVLDDSTLDIAKADNCTLNNRCKTYSNAW